jgi:hypothetical protein
LSGGWVLIVIFRSMPKQLRLKVAAFLLVAFVPLTSCTSPSPSASKDTAKLSLKELEVSDYFAGDSGLDAGTRVEFVSTLKEVHERPLKEVGPKVSAYRLIWLRSLRRPFFVTAYFPDDGASFITAKQYQAVPGIGEPESIQHVELKADRIQMSDEKASSLKRVFEQENFFDIDPYDEFTRQPFFEFYVYGQRFSSRPANNTEDGALWVFEGWNHGKSRILQRQNPSQDDPVRWLGTLLMNESKLLARK